MLRELPAAHSAHSFAGALALIRLAGAPRLRWANGGRTVRLSLPVLAAEGVPEPLHVNIEFDASIVDLMIDRLTVLRALMKPPPSKAEKLN